MFSLLGYFGKVGIHLGNQEGIPILALTNKGSGVLGAYGTSEGYPRIATEEETHAILRFANKEGLKVLIDELQKLEKEYDTIQS